MPDSLQLIHQLLAEDMSLTTDDLQAELRRNGIRLSSLATGLIRSRFLSTVRLLISEGYVDPSFMDRKSSKSKPEPVPVSAESLSPVIDDPAPRVDLSRPTQVGETCPRICLVCLN
jgi:hypothetical protein